jgi:hypothetical protein
VSIVLAVYNGEPFLREAIESILAQTYTAFELIIIDDGSSDSTCLILASFQDARIRLFRNETNIGLTRSLNRGLSQARGTYVARQDADDYSNPARLALQVRFLVSHPDAALVGTQYRAVGPGGRTMLGADDYRARTPLAVQCQLLFANPFIHSSVMFRRAIVCDDLGGYNETFVFSQDFELWSRLLSTHAGYNLSECLTHHRIHPESVGARRADVDSRRANGELNKGVQRKNILRILGDAELASTWPDQWMHVTTSWIAGAPEYPAGVLTLMATLYEKFIARHPEAASDPECRRAYAAGLVMAARGLMPYDRIVAGRALLRAVALAPAVAVRAAPRLAVSALGAAKVRSALKSLLHRLATRLPLRLRKRTSTSQSRIASGR